MNKDDLKKTAILISIATALQMIEYMIPAVIPGLKPGLANIITLIVLFESSYFQALEVSLLRTFLASLITGSFLSPGFFLSFSSAFSSTSIMALLFFINTKNKKKIFSITGISIVGAITHNISQISIARIILIKNNGIFVFIPWLIIGAFFTGWITAKLAYSCIKQIQLIKYLQNSQEKKKPDHSLFSGYKETDKPLKTTHLKICLLIILSVSTIIASSLVFLLSAFILSLLTVIILKSGFFKWLKHMKKLSIILFSASILPFIFSTKTNLNDPVINFLIFHIPEATLLESLEYLLRITTLLTFSFAITSSTPPMQLARSFSLYFKIFRYLGISPERTATLITMAWVLVPSLKDEIINKIKSTPSHKKKIKHFLPLVREIILSFYFPEKNEKNTGFFSQKMK